MESETLMNLIPQTTEEKLLWERDQNLRLVQEIKDLKSLNEELVTKGKSLQNEFKEHKQAVADKNIPQMIEKLNKVKARNENLEIEYKRVLNANNGFMQSVINKNIQIADLTTQVLVLSKELAETKKQLEAVEKPKSLFSFMKKKQ